MTGMTAATWMAMMAAAATATMAQETDRHGYPVLGEEEEVRLAMSAGPLHVSRDADVWVLGDRGFEKVIEGTNGHACLVVRAAVNRGQLAPHCLNPAAVDGVLPAFLAEGELQMRGLAAEAIAERLDARWESGDLPLPGENAWATMLSSGQKLGPNLGAFRPHFMLYQPYATNEQIGGDPSAPAFPFVGPYEDHPLSTVVVLMEEFVHPADVDLPESWRTTRR